jgi:hypothetical protein
MPDGKRLFYPVWVSNSASRAQGRSLMWGRPCDTPGEAQDLGRDLLDRGRATLAFVVEVGPAGKQALPNRTKPESAKKIIKHWLELLEALKAGGAGP